MLTLHIRFSVGMQDLQSEDYSTFGCVCCRGKLLNTVMINH